MAVLSRRVALSGLLAASCAGAPSDSRPRAIGTVVVAPSPAAASTVGAVAAPPLPAEIAAPPTACTLRGRTWRPSSPVPLRPRPGSPAFMEALGGGAELVLPEGPASA